MLHSNLILAQQVVQACIANGIKKVVISPGSRNAPMIIEWNAYPEVQKYSVVDERVAGFFALGMALKTKEPVALVCTSGSALVNYYPAIVEAFYSDIPLLVLSADRPKKLIDIGDGQTIRQENIFQNHIWFNGNLIENANEKNIEILQKGFEIFNQRKAPIHFNIPFSEPLYETSEVLKTDENLWQTSKQNSLLDETPIEVEKLEKFAEKWNQSYRKMVIVGVSQPDEMLQTQLNHLAKDPSVVILTEATSNVHHTEFINHIDRFIFPLSDDDFSKIRPEIILSIGGQVVSKKIKSLIRKNPPLEHWHVDRNWKLDTYHVLSQHFDISSKLFFSQFFFLTKTKESDYRHTWLKINEDREKNHIQFFKEIPYSDLKVYQQINTQLPKDVQVVFSNSAAIRYAQFFDWQKSPHVACNRGTSGIDGSTSTAIGFASVSSKPTLFITGDLSFFYDSNALWNNYIPKNFKIIIINNGGGGIFRFIPGPTTTNTLEFFETPHTLNAQKICEMYGINYHQVTEEQTLEDDLKSFFLLESKPSLLEIFTPREINAEVLKSYFRCLND